jgi:hypothetical protein
MPIIGGSIVPISDTGDPFAHDVLAKPKIFLIGNDHDLAESAGHQP